MFIILTLKIFDRGKKCLLVALILLNGMCLYSKDDWIRWWNYACSLVEKYNFKDVTVTVLKWSLLNQLLHAKLRFLFCSQPDIFNLHTPLPLPSPKKWIIYTDLYLIKNIGWYIADIYTIRLILLKIEFCFFRKHISTHCTELKFSK